jgi:hypothetical protein
VPRAGADPGLRDRAGIRVRVEDDAHPETSLELLSERHAIQSGKVREADHAGPRGVEEPWKGDAHRGPGRAGARAGRDAPDGLRNRIDHPRPGAPRRRRDGEGFLDRATTEPHELDRRAPDIAADGGGLLAFQLAIFSRRSTTLFE